MLSQALWVFARALGVRRAHAAATLCPAGLALASAVGSLDPPLHSLGPGRAVRGSQVHFLGRLCFVAQCQGLENRGLRDLVWVSVGGGVAMGPCYSISARSTSLFLLLFSPPTHASRHSVLAPQGKTRPLESLETAPLSWPFSLPG